MNTDLTSCKSQLNIMFWSAKVLLLPGGSRTSKLQQILMQEVYYYSAKSGNFPFASNCTASRMQYNCIQNQDENGNLAM